MEHVVVLNLDQDIFEDLQEEAEAENISVEKCAEHILEDYFYR